MTAFVPAGDRDPELGFIVHPTAALFPLMGDAELAELAEDIKANGQHDPIVTFKGVLIDGRNRLRACRLAGVEEKFTEWKRLDSAELVHSWILSKNLHRRHLTESQRAMIAGKLARKRPGRPAKETAGIQAVSQSEAASQLNVSRDSVQQATTVLSKGTPELVAAVESGEVAVSRAADIARAAPNDAAAQQAALAKTKEPRAPKPPPAPPPEPDDSTDSTDSIEPAAAPPAGWATCPHCGHSFKPEEA